MDVTISDEQQAITDLAGRILSEQLPAERLRPLRHPDEAVAPPVTSCTGGRTAVVVDVHGESAPRGGDPNVDRCGAGGVLLRVGDRLLDDPVHRCTHSHGQPLGNILEVEANRQTPRRTSIGEFLKIIE